jgi:hypothetical protein
MKLDVNRRGNGAKISPAVSLIEYKRHEGSGIIMARHATILASNGPLKNSGLSLLSNLSLTRRQNLIIYRRYFRN